MYWIAMAVVLGFLVLLCLAGKQETPQGVSSLLRPFYKVAAWLYAKLAHALPRCLFSPQVEKDLFVLHPGESRERLKTEYYVKKSAILLAIVFLGVLFGAAAKFSAQEAVLLGEGGMVVRGSYTEDARTINLTADYGTRRMDFQVEVEPILLSGEEMYRLFEDFLSKLPEYMLGRNESLQNVTSDLKLDRKYGDCPIMVRWESSNPAVLGSDGRVGKVEEKESVMLYLWMTYGEYSRETEVSVTVAPPALTEEEQVRREMEELLAKSQEDSLEEETWRLPPEWRGESLRWSQAEEDYSLLLWAASLGTAVAIFLFTDKDLHGQVEKRRNSIRRVYPEIVHKLVLFVGAGLTVRGAFQKVAGDYEANLRGGGRESPAHEEMLYTCRELQSGVSEGISYEHFGRRTGLQEYIRLCTLLAQNLKKGNSTLLERLREEADKAAEARLQQSKKLGEEAGTKLMAPMMLMLMVVMAIIMVPAFSNM